jgi:DNA-binding NarL/FixJ family response regulator
VGRRAHWNPSDGSTPPFAEGGAAFVVIQHLAPTQQSLSRAPAGSPGQRLSPCEQEILGFVAEGKSNKEIAAALAMAENTVKSHLKSILEKLHVENRVQAATYALRHGHRNKPPNKTNG